MKTFTPQKPVMVLGARARDHFPFTLARIGVRFARESVGVIVEFDAKPGWYYLRLVGPDGSALAWSDLVASEAAGYGILAGNFPRPHGSKGPHAVELRQPGTSTVLARRDFDWE